MSVPGVSGSTMAIILGVYDNLINTISNFHKSIKFNAIYLGKFSAGVGLGIVSLAFFIKWILDAFTIPVSAFFLGLVLGGIPALYRKAKTVNIRLSSIFFFLLGLLIVVSTGYIPADDLEMLDGSGAFLYLMILISGIVVAAALVLPGISTSHMLLVLGMYDDLLKAITEFNILFLAAIGVATAAGIFLITKPIDWTMRNFPHQTYCAIIGFVLGSISSIFRDLVAPAIPEAAPLSWWFGMILFSALAFTLGYRAILLLSRLSHD